MGTIASSKGCPLIVVLIGVCGDGQGRYLVGKRTGKAYSGCWEFPGGKKERGELQEETLVREWREELEVNVQVGKVLFEGSFTTTDLTKFLAVAREVFLQPNAQPKLHDHDAIWWATPEELLALPSDVTTPSLWPISRCLGKGAHGK